MSRSYPYAPFQVTSRPFLFGWITNDRTFIFPVALFVIFATIFYGFYEVVKAMYGANAGTVIELTYGEIAHMALIAVLVLALLAAVTLRYIVSSQIKGQHLAKAKRLNDAMMASAKYMMIATDTQGNILVFNRQAELMMGYEGSEIINRIIPRKWLKDDEFIRRYKEIKKEFPGTEPNFDVFSKRPARDGVEISEWTFVRKSGQEFPVRLSVTPIRDQSTIVGYLGIAEDVTDWNRQRDALKESEETFRTAMENAAIGKALVKLDGSWIKTNRALREMLGYTEEELQRMNFQSISHPEDLEGDLAQVERLLKGEIGSYQIEKRYYHKKGHVIWTLLNVTLVFDADGKPKNFVAQIMNITERKQMERMKNEFISVVSHELRTPLTSIHGSLGLIEGALSDEVPEKVMRLISLANKNSEHLIMLVNDILDLDKFNAGEMNFDIRPRSLDELLRQSIEANRAYALKHNVGLRLNLESENTLVPVDGVRMNQVINNLLSNAAKFSRPHEDVIISVRRIGARVRIEVADRGPGIPHEFRSRIFNKFSQADSSATREKGGTGLGLHITRLLVERMQGQIGFNSEVGEGTVFWVELPIVEQKELVDA